MRLLELHLAAFGPFTNARLDLGTPAHGVHVLYGKNEAGKTTSLRAVTGLLYGIPRDTVDAHTHAMPDLRIGAKLEEPGGEVLEVVRRKGNQRTLLDASGVPVDEARLTRLLGGVSEPLFRTMYGLDHEALRRGAEALLAGKGELGESLFVAALGGGARVVLEELRAEAESIFLPGARAQKPLNEALRSFDAAKKSASLLALSPQTWLDQERAIEEAHAARAKLDEERRALLARANRLERAREHAEASEAVERARTDLASLEARRARIVVSDGLVEGEIEDLQERLGAHRKAERERPRLSAELEQLEGEARAILKRVRPSAKLEDAETLRVSTATHSKLRLLAVEPARLVADLDHAKRREAGVQKELGAARAKLEDMVRGGGLDAEGLARLREACARARGRGDLDERVRDAEEKVKRAGESAASLLAALGLGRLDAAEAAGLAVPVPETLERFAAEADALSKAEARTDEKARELEAKADELDRELDALERAGAVPTESALAEVREERDLAWTKARDAARGKKATFDELADRVEALVRDADALADRLRREATLVTRRARLEADRAACAKGREKIAAEHAALETRVHATDSAWRALWAETGVEPLPPAEMRGWLARHARLVELAAGLRALERDHALLGDQRAALVAELCGALGEGTAREALARVLPRAACRLEDLEDAARNRRAAQEETARLADDLAEAAEERSTRADALAAWSDRWTAEVSVLGLGPEAKPEEATAVLDELAGLFRCLDEAEKARQRMRATEREGQRLGEDVSRLVRAYAPELDGAAFDETAAGLVQRHRKAVEDRVEAREKDRQIAEKRTALDDAVRRCETAAARLADATRASPHPTHLDLDVDAVGDRIVEIDEQLRRIDNSIGGMQGGLEKMRQPSDALVASAKAEEHLARARALAERYARVRLAWALLERQMERYRTRHQGPLVARSSALFARLTLGSFEGLHAGFDDEDRSVLFCVRPGKKDVPVEALSDGTRDQLYLALRLAALETQAALGPALPLVVDDVLIHFDDDRARAALAILGELGEKMQILFFTHHARLAEIAREAIPPARLRIHTLAAAAPPAVAPSVARV